MSSHNLPEVERLCRRVAIIRQGKIVALENIHELRSKRMHHISVRFKDKFDKNDFSGLAEIEEVLPDGLVFSVKGDINPILKKLSTLNITDLEISHATLEEVFLEFYAKDQS